MHLLVLPWITHWLGARMMVLAWVDTWEHAAYIQHAFNLFPISRMIKRHEVKQTHRWKNPLTMWTKSLAIALLPYIDFRSPNTGEIQPIVDWSHSPPMYTIPSSRSLDFV